MWKKCQMPLLKYYETKTKAGMVGKIGFKVPNTGDLKPQPHQILAIQTPPHPQKWAPLERFTK
jgi:hypothetical protein